MPSFNSSLQPMPFVSATWITHTFFSFLRFLYPGKCFLSSIWGPMSFSILLASVFAAVIWLSFPTRFAGICLSGHHSLLYLSPQPQLEMPLHSKRILILSLYPYLSPILGSAVEVGTRDLPFTPLSISPYLAFGSLPGIHSFLDFSTYTQGSPSNPSEIQLPILDLNLTSTTEQSTIQDGQETQNMHNRPNPPPNNRHSKPISLNTPNPWIPSPLNPQSSNWQPAIPLSTNAKCQYFSLQPFEA